MNQPRHAASLHRLLLLLVLAGVLGAACGDEEPEPGLLVFDRYAFDFGVVHVGDTSAEQVFTVRNAGPERVDGLAVRLEPADIFELVGTTCVGWLEPSETCTITVAFTPARAGAVQTGLTVEADRGAALAALEGVGGVIVRVTNAAATSPIVESEPAGIRCGAVCEALFTEPEIVLAVPDDGFAIWSGPCDAMDGGACRLQLDGDVSVDLLDVAAGVQWIYRGAQLSGLAIDGENNVIGIGGSRELLTKIAPAGEVLWQREDLGAGFAVAVDAQGNIGMAGYDAVWKLDGAGSAQWSVEPADMATQLRGVALDPAGNLFMARVQGSETESVVHAVKYDAGGGFEWSRVYAPLTRNEVVALAVDRGGHVIIAGYAHPAPDVIGESVQFLRKYDGEGNALWTNESTGMVGYDLAVDTAGNIFMADRVAGGVPGSYTLQKYSPDGALLWETSAEDVGGLVYGLAATPTGDVIAVGTRFGEAGSALGVWAAKFDGLDGTRRRPVEIQLRGTAQFGWDVAVDASGDVLVAGGQDEPWLRKYDGAVFDLLDE